MTSSLGPPLCWSLPISDPTSETTKCGRESRSLRRTCLPQPQKATVSDFGRR